MGAWQLKIACFSCTLHILHGQQADLQKLAIGPTVQTAISPTMVATHFIELRVLAGRLPILDTQFSSRLDYHMPITAFRSWMYIACKLCLHAFDTAFKLHGNAWLSCHHTIQCAYANVYTHAIPYLRHLHSLSCAYTRLD